MAFSRLLVLPYGGVEPRLAAAPKHVGEGAAVLGRASIGAGAFFGPRAVVRADGHFVEIGDDFHLGPRSTVHIAHDVYPTLIGHRVTVGMNACVHACTVGNDVIVDDGSVILDGSIVEDEVILEPGTFAFPRARLSRGHVYAGAPAKPVRALMPGELAERREKIVRAHANGTEAALGRESRGAIDPSAFIASTATVRGAIHMAAGTSIWFSNDIDAGGASFTVGPNSNVQDNTIVRCSGAGVIIGRDTTIGHNVFLNDCVIGDESLIGIGSFVEKGTRVEDHVLLAAGARTEPGQVLESGWLYGRAPARKIAPLDQDKRELIKFIIWTYCQYAKDFQAAQNALERAPIQI